MILHIVNRDHMQWLRGDIIAVLPDNVLMGPLEVVSLWLANDPVGLPEEYKTPAEGGTFPERTTANFPNPWSSVARFPSYRCDLNLAEPWLEIDITELDATQTRGPNLWYLDLDALPPGTRNSLQQPGGDAQLGANRLSAVKTRHDGSSVTVVPGWQSDTTKGSQRHRHSGTMARDRLGIA